MKQNKNISDLKLIDELLCLMKPLDCRWEQFEFQYSITQIAIERLRKAWEAGEMKSITFSLANYIDKEKRFETRDCKVEHE